MKSSQSSRRKRMKRYGQVIKVNEEKLDYYKELHANPWPEVLDMISKCNIKNYSIYLKDDFLFAYFEYHGDNFEADMAKMAADPTTIRWWAECKPCQQPLATAGPDEWWSNMEEVFHWD
jgi:L-rhamnose mutarotase